MIVQLCRDCLWTYKWEGDRQTPCLSCDSKQLTIPTSENLVRTITMLLDRGIEVSRGSCNIHDVNDDIGYIGKTVQLQIELGRLYPTVMFQNLPPGWLLYEYHSIEDYNTIGPKYTGLSHTNSFVDDDELEFATALTVSNIEVWLKDIDKDAYKAIWTIVDFL